jgi:cytidylate kinase
MIEVVSIDGPSGSGKSTASKLLAKRLSYNYLDTGAMYRAFALVALEIDAEDDEKKYKPLLENFEVNFTQRNNQQRVCCNGKDVTEAIRMPDVAMWASTLSKEKEVRDKMGSLQREIGEKGKIVAEGRDMGTVVFKDAFAKFYLVASPEIRAQRRYKELKEKKISMTMDKVLSDMLARDEQDSMRDIAPLRPAEDAVIIDTSSLSPDGMLDKMYDIVMEKYRLWKS